VRRLRGGEKLSVSFPSCIVDYQRWMGGVDIHDQLRLQRYSLQMAFIYKKYYKGLFLGLVDLALVNAYIVYKAFEKAEGRAKPKHSKFLETLHAQLLEMTAATFNATDVNTVLVTYRRMYLAYTVCYLGWIYIAWSKRCRPPTDCDGAHDGRVCGHVHGPRQKAEAAPASV
jgi:hypothetical protein